MDEKKVQEQTKKIIGKGRKVLRLGVNIFVYTFVGIFMILLLLFGVSQTSIFKNWLRETIVETVNEQINGKLSIEKLEGTIFTSLIIKNVTLTSQQKDTVIQAGQIELKTSPLKLLFKNIYVRKFELRDANIKIVKESDGELNLLKIFPPSTEPEDSTSAEFPFTIEVADFGLKNIDFSIQNYDKVGSKEFYKSLNSEDLRIENLDVSLNAFADLNKYEYKVAIKNVSFSPNFQIFNLKHLDGTFLLTRNTVGINKLRVETDQSDFELSLGIVGIDILEDFSKEKLSEASMRFTVIADRLNFDDLITYFPSLNSLNGTISTELEGKGTINDLNIKTLNVDYENTSLNAKANLKNLLDTDKMFINISFNNSYLDPSDLNKLLKNIELSEYKDFGVIQFDTLNYTGNLKNFTSSFAMRTDRGNLRGTAKLDFMQTEMKYDIKLFTQKLDLSPFITLPTNINSEISINGTGTEPEKMKAQINLLANSSTIGKKFLKTVTLKSDAEAGLIKTFIKFYSDTGKVDLSSTIDFKNPDDPTYEIKGEVSGLNLGQLLDDKSLNSNFNLTINASGQGFNPDSLDLFLVTDLKNSNFDQFQIDSTRLILDVRRNDEGNKVINIVSDIADFTLIGDYSITTLGDVFTREGDLIASTIKEKIDPIFDSDSIYQSASDITGSKLIAEHIKDFNFTYLLDFKEALKIDLGGSTLELDGQMQGKMNSVADSLSFNLAADFGYLKYLSNDDIYFIVNSKLELAIANQLNESSNNNIYASLKLSSERLYAGGNIYDLNANAIFRGNDLDINFKGKYEDYLTVRFNSKTILNGRELDLKIPALDLYYKNLRVNNLDEINLSYKDKTIYFKDFLLNTADGTISLTGDFGSQGEHNASLSVNKINGERISRDLLGSQGNNTFDSDINAEGLFSGNFSNPKFTVNVNFNNMTFGKSNFGSLVSKFDYADNSLSTDIRIIDSLQKYNSPEFLVSGFIPLMLTASKDSLNQTPKSLTLKIESDEYDLSALGDIIPYLKFQKGKLETDIYITGTVDQPVAIGYFTVFDGSIKINYNNLDYDFGTKVWIDDEVITIESIELKNKVGTKYGGSIIGEGIIKLKNFNPDSVFVKLNGDLKLLDNNSKSGNPFIYGDLAVQTRGDITYTSLGGKSFLNMPIDVTVADLIVPLNQSAYSSASGFIYRYAENDSVKNKLYEELDSLILASIQKNGNGTSGNGNTAFGYSLDLNLDTEAEVIVNLSRELDQNLVVVLDGNILLESKDGISKTSGEFFLLEGSKLSFIKSFEAEGNVKFKKLDDPILDITATYKDYYYPAVQQNEVFEQEVAVKIKLKGPLSDLNKNFIQDENNIGVYMGKDAIEKNRKDGTKNASDALFFIITGRFTDGATQQERNAVASTATTLAGSVLGGFLNQYLGDYVKSVQLRQVGTETKFNLIGKVNKFKYEVGGSTDILQDLSRANIKIEYPLINNILLRLERKESENQKTATFKQLYNEFGIKYSYEF